MADTSGPGSLSIPPNANFKGGFKLPALGALGSEVRQGFPGTRSEGGVTESPQTRPPRKPAASACVALTGVPRSPRNPPAARSAPPQPGRVPGRGRASPWGRGAPSCHSAQTLRAPGSPLTARRGGSRDPVPGSPAPSQLTRLSHVRKQ